MTVSFQIPDEVWMEIVQASCEVEEKKSYGEYLDLKEPFQLWQIRQQERQHSVYALSQTSKYFCNLLACKLFSHPAIAYEGDDRIDRHSLLIQLKQMLERPIVRENIHSLTLDFRDLGDYSLCFAYDLKRKWEKDLEYSDYARNIIPTLRDFIKVEDELAQKLRGLSLKHFEWRGVWRPSTKIYEALGSIETLESVTFDWSYMFMPTANSLYEADALSHLSQVRAAALGMGNQDDYGGRDNPWYHDPSCWRVECPGLFDFLINSNKLRYLFLAAPLLYCQKTIIPCCAKVLLITDDSLSREEPPSDTAFSFPSFGELTSYDSTLDKSEGRDIPLARAASNFRRLLKAKALSKEEHSLCPQDVLDLIYEQSLLRPWREWFPREVDSLKVVDGVDDKAILEEVIERLKETIDEEIQEGDRARFSKKSYFMLDTNDAQEY